MQTLTRIAAAAIGTTLTAGALVLSPASAQNVEAGGIQVWGTATANFAQSGGPYKSFASHAGTDTFAIGMDDKLVALPGVRASLAVPSDPSAAAGNVAGTTVRSVSIIHQSAAWAVTADGAVHKWGGARGVIIPDGTWTPTQMGGEAVEVFGAGSTALARLANGRVVHIDSFGITPCADGDQPLTGAQKLGYVNSILMSGGRVVKTDPATGCDATTLIAADASDPVISLTAGYATTESGRILQTVAGSPAAPNVPTDFDGKAVKAVTVNSIHSALLTNRGEVVVWRSSGGAPDSNYQLPTGLQGRAVLDLQASADTALTVLYADVANHVKPAITGSVSVGSTLTASEGDWLGKPTSLDYQWLAADEEISGADEATFVPAEAQLGKALKVRVTAKRGSQEVSATSVATAAVAEGVVLEATSAPTVAGTAQSGQSLTGTAAVFSDEAASVTNQWLANGEAITGQTGTTLALTDAQVGKKISFRSTAVLGDQTVPSISVETAAVTAAPAVASTTNVSAATRAYGQAGSVTVTVSASKAVAGKVTLTGAGTQVKAVSGGKATFALPKNLAAKRYALKATFTSSSSAVAGSTRTATFTVAKGKTSKPALKFTKAPTSKKTGKATVTVGTVSGLAKASGKVTITLKGKGGKTVKGTVKNGKATVSLPKLKKGTYKVTVSYAGNSNYVAAKSKTYSLKIKK